MHLNSNTPEFFFFFHREAWPLDGMKFETLNEMQANKIPENLEIDVGKCLKFDTRITL